MFRVSMLTMVCVVLVACVTTGCEKDEKFTFPENPAPWSPDLQPAGAGAGAGGGGGGRPRSSESEQQDKQGSEDAKTTEAGQDSDGEQTSAGSGESNEVNDEAKSEAKEDQQSTGGSNAGPEKTGE